MSSYIPTDRDTTTHAQSYVVHSVLFFRNKLLDEISPIYSNLENMISSYTKDGFFREKKHGPNSPDFKEQKKKFQIPRVL
jgi:hypothetical protein